MTDPNLVGGGGVDAAELSRIDDSAAGPKKPRSLWADAWRQLRRKPSFLIAAVILLLVVLIAIAPGLFAHGDPGAADLTHANEGPSGDAWFGYDNQGYDVYTRTIYGARASLLVGIFATVLTVLFGSFMGIVAGYYGRLVDSVFSRFGDIFAGLPFVLGAIVILTTFNAPGSNPGQVTIIVQVVLSIAVLSWPVAMRIMRSATLVAKQLDYVKAARALGAGTPRIVFRHLLPNTLAPVLVYATIALGANIGAEATLAYLGIGVRPPVVSWGVMISDSRDYFRAIPHMLLFPGAFVTITVLAFVMLGDGIRDALDPKSR
ncbi:ABC transporter permease [Amycolatopsis jiangsuensis]|uniref:Oligopeptide transport system permease protein n=1 Tax=Amycolatopsis jiangsuensis TaxID=1181879 RepID=A0A840J3M1_9PSEU|nr:ABC transporter permease [Amycolatopsis jiangsuensis]MBB4688319.1 oligopeptide transport system permease protein [Amycolatopsis jiangsuensis]